MLNSLTPSLYFPLDEPCEECQFPQLTADQKKVQKNKDQTCKELQLIFLGSEKQPLFECKCECNFECNCRFPWFSEILSYCQKPLKNKAFSTSIVSYLSFPDASSPVSRTSTPEIVRISGVFRCLGIVWVRRAHMIFPT